MQFSEASIFPVLGYWLTKQNAKAIELNKTNIPANVSLHNPRQFQAWIDQQCAGKIGHGGYLEKRDVYAQSEVFVGQNNARNMHLGIDLWTKAGTNIYAVADGEIYATNNLMEKGNYGGVVIIKHRVNSEVFYTLYGHLHYDQVPVKVGGKIAKGTLIGKLGSDSHNGGWPPHLHFQLIKNMGQHGNDYPGVCFENEVDFYKKNCPDPSRFIFDCTS